MASKEAEKTFPEQSNVPNKRERLAAQHGQLDDVNSSDWSGDPTSLQDALNRLAAAVAAGASGPIA